MPGFARPPSVLELARHPARRAGPGRPYQRGVDVATRPAPPLHLRDARLTVRWVDPAPADFGRSIAASIAS